MQDIYMDYNATAPVRDEVLEVFQRTLRDCAGNASSAHFAGRRAKAVLDQSRESLAESLGCRPGEIVLTSGGTESDNLAVKGVALRAGAGHLVIGATEHPAVMQACRFLERECFEVTVVPVGADGRVSPEGVQQALRGETVLVSVMWVNNETGVIQPVSEIAAVAHDHGVPFHTDAVQAFGRVDLHAGLANVDLLSISAHKFGGPNGVGALFVRKGLRLEAVSHGGGQEWNLRSGTHNVAGVAAMAEAARLAAAEREAESTRLAALRDRLETGVRDSVGQTAINGGDAERVGNTSNIRFDGADGEALLLALDAEGIAVSSASACAAAHTEPSHVLMAMGLSRREAEDSMRFSLGRLSSEEDVDNLLKLLPGVVDRVRSARSS